MSTRVPDQLTCRQIVELLTDYMEGHLPLDQRTALEQHLVYCDWCRVYLEQMRQTIRAAGEVPKEPPDAKTREDLLRIFRDWKVKK
jgi:anti-sigma factor RsiW